MKEKGAILKGKDLRSRLKEVDNHWKLVQEHHIEKEYHFKNFKDALKFVNAVGRIAEKQGHHPYIYLGWGIVMLAIWTHDIDGLTEKDFILAELCDKVIGPDR